VSQQKGSRANYEILRDVYDGPKRRSRRGAAAAGRTDVKGYGDDENSQTIGRCRTSRTTASVE